MKEIELVTRPNWFCHKCFPSGLSDKKAKVDDDHLCMHHALLEILKAVRKSKKEE